MIHGLKNIQQRRHPGDGKRLDVCSRPLDCSGSFYFWGSWRFNMSKPAIIIRRIQAKQFLDMASMASSYYDGKRIHSNGQDIWDVQGEPDVILIRNDGHRITMKAEHFQILHTMSAPVWLAIFAKEPNKNQRKEQ